MSSNVRKRRIHPAHMKHKDDGSSSGVKPMSLIGSPRTENVPDPSPFMTQDNLDRAPPLPTGSMVNRPPKSSHSSPTISSHVDSPSYPGYPVNNQGVNITQHYPHDGVQRYSIGDSDDDINSARINTSANNVDHNVNINPDTYVPSPFLTKQTPAWQPLQHGSNDRQDVPFGTMHKEPGFQESNFPVSNLNWKGSFTQQIKQLSEYYMQHAQSDESEVDPPLLEELGIDVDDIIRHIKCVVLFKSVDNKELQYGDFTGSLLILILFALCMIVSCKLNLGLVYAVEVLGNTSPYILFNLLCQDVYIELSKLFIILGYSLLPICLAPLIWIFSRFAKPLILLLIYLCVVWSTSTATRLLTMELNMADRKYIVLFPILIYYMFLAHTA
uniref:Yip1 domain containing protein n=1 Tax=Babesia bovis TaxID=5865 RepID=S6B1Y9_BABBO|nr:hypothetical protein [Babesia bovis]